MQNNPFTQKAQYYLNESHRLNEELSAELEYNALLEEILILALNEGVLTGLATALAPGAARAAGRLTDKIKAGTARSRGIVGNAAKVGATTLALGGAVHGLATNDPPLYGLGIPTITQKAVGGLSALPGAGEIGSRVGSAAAGGVMGAVAGGGLGAAAGAAAAAIGSRNRQRMSAVKSGAVSAGKPILGGVARGIGSVVRDVGGGINDAITDVSPRLGGALGRLGSNTMSGLRTAGDNFRRGYNGGLGGRALPPGDSDLQATNTPKLLGTDNAPTRGPVGSGTKGKRKTGNKQFESTSLDVLSSVLHELYTSGRITENQIITCEASLRGLVRKIAPYVGAAAVGAGVVGGGAHVAKPFHDDIQKVAHVEFEKGVDNLSSNPLTHPVDAMKKAAVHGSGLVDRATPYLAKAWNATTGAIADTTGIESARTNVSTESPGIRNSMRDAAIKPGVDAAQNNITKGAAGLGAVGGAAVAGAGAAVAAWRRRRRGTTPTAGTVAEDIMKILMKRR